MHADNVLVSYINPSPSATIRYITLVIPLLPIESTFDMSLENVHSKHTPSSNPQSAPKRKLKFPLSNSMELPILVSPKREKLAD
jgi:hypothetical protein